MEKYILGISAFYHDSSACLILDGEIVAASSEERFSRVKNDSSFPKSSIEFCLSFAGIELDQVSAVVFHEKPLLTFERIVETFLNNVPRGFRSFKGGFSLWVKEKIFIKSLIQKELRKISGHKKSVHRLYFSGHHLSHAAAAYYPSHFNKAAILCMDGVGEWATATIWKAEGKKLEILKQINFPDSLGLLYSAFTVFCGFKVNEGEYKLMGLAPYGEPIFADIIKSKIIDIKEDGSFRLDMSYFGYINDVKMTSPKFESLFGGPPRGHGKAITQREKDLAASIQQVTEEIIFAMAIHAKELAGFSNLCLGGGVALNCVSNGKLLRSTEFEDIWVQPAAGDAGSSLGAALGFYYSSDDSVRSSNKSDMMKGSLLGESFSNDSIEDELKRYKLRYKEYSPEELLDVATSLILEDKVIGWFQGRSEFGPRALGSRSILGNALNKDMQKNLNLKIKFRESFRPFAPAVLKSDAAEYFPAIKASPYMQFVDTLANGFDFPAVSHVDNTSRVQTVDEEANPLFHSLLQNLKEKSGYGVVINTSFNINGEPIVNSPKDAVNCFLKTDMDCLCIGSFLVHKEEQTEQSLMNEPSPEEVISNKEFYLFWLKVLIFCLILRFVTLPFFGMSFSYFYLLVFALPLSLRLISPFLASRLTQYSRKYLLILERAFNSLLMGMIYFLFLTPYGILLKLFNKPSLKTEESYWSEGQDIKIDERQF